MNALVRSTAPLVLTMAAVGWSGTARADGDPADSALGTAHEPLAAEQVQAPAKPEWYGWRMLMVDAAVFGLLQWTDVPPEILISAYFLNSVFNHALEGNDSGAIGVFALRLGVPVVITTLAFFGIVYSWLAGGLDRVPPVYDVGIDPWVAVLAPAAILDAAVVGWGPPHQATDDAGPAISPAIAPVAAGGAQIGFVAAF